MNKLMLTQQELDDHLFAACASGNISYARLAISGGANVNAHSAKPTTLSTRLHLAARLASNFGGVVITKLLIDNGADVLAINGLGERPADIAQRNNAVELADLINTAARQTQGHADRVADERKDKGPPQVGG